MARRVIVGLGVLVMRDGKVLLGKRKGSHGAGKHAFPGGHQDHGETWAECAVREVKEETGMVVKFRPFTAPQNYLCVTDDYMPEDDKHYNTVYVICDWQSGEPQLLEPNKCEKWEWVTFADIGYYWSEDDHYSGGSWIPYDHIAINLDRIGLK